MMEKSFDFVALLQNHENHEKQHKCKPVQFSSVANGVKRRLDSNIKRRRSSRLTVFDKIRNIQQLEKIDSPLPKSDKQQKIEHRRMQLEKWKEDKEKKKKEAATQKKKPFIVGVAHAPPRFVPPPPPPKVMPSTSGRVTRSQSRNKASQQGSATRHTVPNQSKTSFAPLDATFRPPQLKHLETVPTLTLPKRKGKAASMVKFEPHAPNRDVKSSTKPNLKAKFNSNMKKTTQYSTSTSGSSMESEENGPVKKPIRKSKEPIINNKTQKSNKLIKKLLHNSTNSTETDSSPVEVKVKTPRKSKEANKTPDKKNLKKSVISINSSSSETSMESPAANKRTPRSSLGKKYQPSKMIQGSNSDSSMGSPIENKMKTARKSNQASPVKRTPLKPIPKSESSSEERLRSPKSPVEVMMTPEQIVAEAKRISPCVTLSRGKDNARREMKQKIAEGLLDEDLNDMESIDHFKKQLNSEIKRLSELCDTWDKISEQNINLPEVVQEAILGAVGQARLLMTQKLQQFAGLVARCETPDPSQPLVTAVDLHGFWDMVFMQVVNVDMRFKKLDKMKARSWTVEEQPVVQRRKVVSKPKTTKPAATSRIRDMIAAARKAKKEQEPKAEETQQADDSKTFEAGFFSVRSPVRCPPISTPNKPTLLKAVLSSEAKKASASKNSASFAMLRASMFGKNVEQEPTSDNENLLQFTPVNLHATPGRSILKSGTAQSKKSIKCVLFDSSDTDILDNSIDKDMSGIQQLEDTELCMDLEKENRKKLVRQDAVEQSPIMTRNRRKSLQTPNKEDIVVKKILEESDLNTSTRPRRATRKKSLVDVA
ncbi:guanylate kinase-associated protein mars-like isoform X1 [Colias croceus]|uniref:guanylate kinase-associated protein mars-like isoform X1 n=1 Tax=Colias crocea TaxID=72248 RepID=UPI001E27BB81|nr:guanylate kinase-associated protein mars-like isoform X1 [Colias croceus]